MASFTRKDPKPLSDPLLALEITYAHRAVTKALADRRERRNPSDAGALMLDDAVAEAGARSRVRGRWTSACTAATEHRRSGR